MKEFSYQGAVGEPALGTEGSLPCLPDSLLECCGLCTSPRSQSGFWLGGAALREGQAPN